MDPGIHLFEPPKAQRAGGLEVAVSSLASWLAAQSIAVTRHEGSELPASIGANAVVHFHGVWQPAFLRAAAACRSRGVPYVVSPHGMLEPWAWDQRRLKKRIWFGLFERAHLRRAAALLATSALEVYNLARQFPDRPCRAIPLGVQATRKPNYEQARRALGWDPSERVLLFLSRIHPKKGLDLLLEALRALPNAKGAAHRVRLVVVGDGEPGHVEPLREFARRHAEALPRVDWVGGLWTDAKWAYLEAADLLCLPSHSENFGYAILEALQVGTRVLTTTRTPWTDLEAWGAGYLVEPDAESVRGALARFLTEPAWGHAQRESLAARIDAAYSWRAVGPAYLDLYRSVASAHGRAG